MTLGLALALLLLIEVAAGIIFIMVRGRRP